MFSLLVFTILLSVYTLISLEVVDEESLGISIIIPTTIINFLCVHYNNDRCVGQGGIQAPSNDVTQKCVELGMCSTLWAGAEINKSTKEPMTLKCGLLTRTVNQNMSTPTHVEGMHNIYITPAPNVW